MAVVLEVAGSSLDKIVKLNVYLRSGEDFVAMNEVYFGYFGAIKPVCLSSVPNNGNKTV